MWLESEVWNLVSFKRLYHRCKQNSRFHHLPLLKFIGNGSPAFSLQGAAIWSTYKQSPICSLSGEVPRNWFLCLYHDHLQLTILPSEVKTKTKKGVSKEEHMFTHSLVQSWYQVAPTNLSWENLNLAEKVFLIAAP